MQFITAQLARKPLLEDVRVGTDLVIGTDAGTPLHLKIPLFVSDSSSAIRPNGPSAQGSLLSRR